MKRKKQNPDDKARALGLEISHQDFPREIRILAAGMAMTLMSDERVAEIIGTALGKGDPDTPNIRYSLATAMSLVAAVVVQGPFAGPPAFLDALLGEDLARENQDGDGVALIDDQTRGIALTIDPLADTIGTLSPPEIRDLAAGQHEDVSMPDPDRHGYL